MTKNSGSDLTFHHIPFSSPNPHSILPLLVSSSKYNNNAKKKRSKISKNCSAASISSSPKPSSRLKYSKKPDPNAPKITRPCTECGKKFWSWKALFGHMRCHPEREWRGMNPPPPSHRRTVSPTKQQLIDSWVSVMSEVDHDVASCLLMLANSAGPCGSTRADAIVPDSRGFSFRVREVNESSFKPQLSSPDLGFRFECGGCKKVFGSHQALGGHRASHKNVKGCFASTRSCEIQETAFNEHLGNVIEEEKKTVKVLGHHWCSICYRVFPSGQALGGHMRCHWEEPQPQGLNHQVQVGPNSLNFIDALDLNVAATTENDSSSSYSDTDAFSLDLRLGL